MRQTSLLVVLTYSFYFIITLVPVFTVYFVHGHLERGVAILVTLTLSYGTKIRSNEKKYVPFFLGRSKNIKSTKST